MHYLRKVHNGFEFVIDDLSCRWQSYDPIIPDFRPPPLISLCSPGMHPRGSITMNGSHPQSSLLRPKPYLDRRKNYRGAG